jgi:hypothetical protein
LNHLKPCSIGDAIFDQSSTQKSVFRSFVSRRVAFRFSAKLTGVPDHFSTIRQHPWKRTTA